MGAAAIRVGTSGWSYPHWRKRFYPQKMPAREHFSFYANQFDTVELNNSFYRQPTRERFEEWARQSREGFLFAVKASRYISHIKRLAVEDESVERVVEAARGLGDHLGPILFQFPATFHLDLDRLDHFLPMLRMPERFTLEFRHDSWLIPAVYERLRRQSIALCIPDHPTMPQAFEITTDFTYVRMHLGAHGIGYTRRELRAWAGRLLQWRQEGTASYVYFNNDMEGCAIRDARTLRNLLKEGAREGRDSNPGSGNTRSSA